MRSSVKAANDNHNDELIGRTREVWQPRLGRDVSRDEAASRDCALRWMRQGRRVRIARPPRGMDFNDMLLGRAPGIEEGAQ